MPPFPERPKNPAGVRCFRSIGVDTVGMSTVPEAIVAHHIGMRVAGMSVLSMAEIASWVQRN